MSASEELERIAVNYAKEAIRLDNEGSRTTAISRYERAIGILCKLCTLYPEATQNRVYLEHIESYRSRIKQLKAPTQEAQADSGSASGTANFDDLVIYEKPNVKWDEIADLREAKRAVEESIIFPARRPDLFPLGWPRGILFFGPPGCGKTLLAAAIATEINGVFFSVDASSIMSKWLGESEKNVAHLFEKARNVASKDNPAIIFIDEIESIVGRRDGEVGGEVRMRNQFLKEMDSINDKTNPVHVHVIGATNKPWALDDPFIRRFQKRLYVPLPDLEARTEMLKIFSKNLNLHSDVDLQRIVKLTDGYSGSDLRDLFQSAQLRVVREYFESSNGSNSGNVRPISMEDLNGILHARKPSVSPRSLQWYEKWYDSFKGL